MTNTAKLVLAGVVVAGAVYYFKKRGGCGCGGAAHAPGPAIAAPSVVDDDGPESEGYSVGAIAERAQLFARDAFAEIKAATVGGCGCGK